MIALISDSHVPNRSPGIPEQFTGLVEKADLTVHCGDFETKQVYERLDNKAGNLVAVKGNCDRFELPNSETFEEIGLSFGVYHGTGISPRGDHDTLVKIAEEDLDVDVLLHGHTHQQEAVEKDGKILLNPGSCTGVGGGSSTRKSPRMMLLKFENGLNVELLKLVDKEIVVEKQKNFDIKGLTN